MNKKEITSIEFVFENCESIEIPFECFSKFKIENLENLKNEDSFESLECAIKDNGQTKYTYGFPTLVTPLQRINKNDDITSIYIKYKNETVLQLICPWFFENEYDNSQNNEYQASVLVSFNEVELMVLNNSKWYSLSEALDKFVDGTVIKDENGKLYEIFHDDKNDVNCLSLSNSYISSKLLNSRFQKAI